MKRTTSLILCLVLSISLFAQSRGVTFQVHNETLTSVLKKIEKAGEKNILFAYQATDQYRVTANIQAKRQKEALEMVLQGKPFSFVEQTPISPFNTRARQPGWNRSRAGWWMSTRSLCLLPTWC